MRLRDVRTAQVKNKRVILRVDYNVATTKASRPRDLTRLVTTVPTIRWLVQHGATVMVVSHRGRPHGRQRRLSLKPFVRPLSRLIGRPVGWIEPPVYSRIFEQQAAALKPRQVALLENIRFEPGEEDNSRRLAKRLAGLADLLVNDAFADSHRVHASIVGLAEELPSYAGFLLQQEFINLTRLVTRPARPYVAILGGAKISTKLHLIARLLKQADHVLLGGALANTILQAEGTAIGASLSEPAVLKQAAGLSVTNKKLSIPCDVVTATSRRPTAQRYVRPVGKVGRREIIVDIGPDTLDLYRRIIAAAKTVVWNGPMGIYEVPAFARGTVSLARVIAGHRGRTVAGGGETLDAIHRAGVQDKFTWLSTGGGAMLEFLEGRTLPGLAAVAFH